MSALTEHESILCVYAESARGPGWANHPLWVVIQDKRNGAVRVEAIQPDEQIPQMVMLYPIAEQVHAALKGLVEWHLRRES